MTDRPRTVFLTGATGVLGSAILNQLLRDPAARIVVIVRARDSAEARLRLSPVLAYLNVDPASPAAARIEVVRGDVSVAHLGMDERDYERLSGTITDIIHAAGNVRLDQPIELARRDAVIPTQHVVAFAEACRTQGSFGKCEFVSTVGVCGRMQGTVPETVLGRPRSFRNTYEEAKAEGEDMVLARMQAGLSATIHRPSMIVGDSLSGRILHPQIFYFLVEWLLGNRLGGWVPTLDRCLLDIIPVDYVARAIVLSNRTPESKGRIFHLCSGPESAIPMAELQSRVRALASACGYPVSRTRTIRSKWIWGLLSKGGALLPGKMGRASTALPFLLSYLEDPQTFQNAMTQAFFSPRNLKVPSLDSYFELMLTSYFQLRASKTGSAGHRRPSAD